MLVNADVPELLLAPVPSFHAVYYGVEGTAGYIEVPQYICSKCGKKDISVHPYQACCTWQVLGLNHVGVFCLASGSVAGAP